MGSDRSDSNHENRLVLPTRDRRLFAPRSPILFPLRSCRAVQRQSIDDVTFRRPPSRRSIPLFDGNDENCVLLLGLTVEETLSGEFSQQSRRFRAGLIGCVHTRYIPMETRTTVTIGIPIRSGLVDHDCFSG